jgi:hypothetical protein
MRGYRTAPRSYLEIPTDSVKIVLATSVEPCVMDRIRFRTKAGHCTSECLFMHDSVIDVRLFVYAD